MPAWVGAPAVHPSWAVQGRCICAPRPRPGPAPEETPPRTSGPKPRGGAVPGGSALLLAEKPGRSGGRSAPLGAER